MTDSLDHSHRRNLRHWIAGGFLALAVIFYASFNPLGPGIDPGEFGAPGNMKLAPAGTGGGLSAVIPKGYRAMTVKVDHVVGVSGLIMPGSFVDIVVILPESQAGATKGPISKIVLRDIKVLASRAKIDSSDNQAVTLQVTTEQREKLVLAANEGKLQLVLRNYPDQEDTQSIGSPISRRF